jgi:hypothetical protein
VLSGLLALLFRAALYQNQDLFQFLNTREMGAIVIARQQFLRLFAAISRDRVDPGALMSQQVVTVNPATVELSPSPFPTDWVLDGAPRARATAIAHSRDGAMTVIAWSCTQGSFRWQYHVDEMVHILSGEVFVTDETGSERRLGPGDTAFFPAASSAVWRVTQDVRKVAVCHVAMPKLVCLGLRVWNKLWRVVSELLGLDAEPAGSGGGLVAAEQVNAAQGPSVASAPPA